MLIPGAESDLPSRARVILMASPSVGFLLTPVVSAQRAASQAIALHCGRETKSKPRLKITLMYLRTLVEIKPQRMPMLFLRPVFYRQSLTCTQSRLAQRTSLILSPASPLMELRFISPFQVPLAANPIPHPWMLP